MSGRAGRPAAGGGAFDSKSGAVRAEESARSLSITGSGITLVVSSSGLDSRASGLVDGGVDSRETDARAGGLDE